MQVRAGVILERDSTAIAPEQIATAHGLTMIVGSRIVYEGDRGTVCVHGHVPVQCAPSKKKEFNRVFSKMSGLVDFVKDFGANLFTSDVEAAMKILQHVEANNPGVNPLHVEFDDGVATLRGMASSQEAAEKVILMVGNVKGVERVEADDLIVERPKAAKPATQAAAPAAPPASQPAAAANTTKVEFYTIQRGDTLSAIAKRYYGNAMKYPRLFEANREVILDPNKIYPGQKIRIPLD
jgi:LysM repeat protein